MLFALTPEESVGIYSLKSLYALSLSVCQIVSYKSALIDKLQNLIKCFVFFNDGIAKLYKMFRFF